MSQVNIIVLIFYIGLLNSHAQINSISTHYELAELPHGDGIIVEVFDSTIIDENKYNNDNVIFKVGSSFKYKYEHRTKTDELKYFRNDTVGWLFVDADKENSATIKYVTISVASGNTMAAMDLDYDQTCLNYKLDRGYGHSMSGVIENEANVWMHPPRSDYFKILQLNPYPYIKAPYELGAKWDWKLKIGAYYWMDIRWKTWEGNIENNYQYEITDKCILETVIGNIECFIIDATAKSRLGDTKLRAYFNEKLGFVKLDYVNIDGSQTNLELVEYIE